MASLLRLKTKASASQNKLAALQAGKEAEERALSYLQQQGLQLLSRNFRCKAGEIDLIMQHREVLVFIEVKYRHTDQYGGALMSLSARQQQRIIKAASFYLMRYAPHAQARFDVIAQEGEHDLQWLPNAFTTDF